MKTIHITTTQMAGLLAEWSISVAPVDGVDRQAVTMAESPDGRSAAVYVLPAGGGNLGPFCWVVSLDDSEIPGTPEKALLSELRAMAREGGILGACTAYEWCEQAQDRFTARGVAIDVRPINSTAIWHVAKLELERLSDAGQVIRHGAARYEAKAPR